MAERMLSLAGKDYFTVEQAAEYAGISYSHWRARIQREFPPGEFYGVAIYRRRDIDNLLGIGDVFQTQCLRLDNSRRRYPRQALRSAARRAARLKRMPAWADQSAIQCMYAMARRVSDCLGATHHVDHIIPLQGITVSGLHVERNLRVVPMRENLKKGRRWP